MRDSKKFDLWRIYYSVLVLLGPLALVTLRFYSRFTHQARVRVALVNEKQEILLVRGAIGSRKWSLPGGGIERGEAAEVAAIREIKEELRYQVSPESLTYLFTAVPGEEFPRLRYEAPLYSVRCQKATIDSTKYQKVELQAVQWFAIDELPEECSSLVVAAIRHLPNSSKIGKMD